MSEFNAELAALEGKLKEVQTHITHRTSELAEERKLLAHDQTKVQELEAEVRKLELSQLDIEKKIGAAQVKAREQAREEAERAQHAAEAASHH